MPTSVASTTLYIKTGSSLKDQVTDMSLDFDGDGIVDDKFDSLKKFDDYDLIIRLVKFIDKNCGSTQKCKSMKTRLEKIKSKISNSSDKKFKNALHIVETIGHVEKSNTNQNSNDKIIQNLSQYIKQLE